MSQHPNSPSSTPTLEVPRRPRRSYIIVATTRYTSGAAAARPIFNSLNYERTQKALLTDIKRYITEDLLRDDDKDAFSSTLTVWEQENRNSPSGLIVILIGFVEDYERQIRSTASTTWEIYEMPLT